MHCLLEAACCFPYAVARAGPVPQAHESGETVKSYFKKVYKEGAQHEHCKVGQLSPGVWPVGVAAFVVLGPGSRSAGVPLGVVALIPGVAGEVAPIPGAGPRRGPCAEELPPGLRWGATVCLSPCPPGCLPLPGLGWPGRGPGVHQKLASKSLSGFGAGGEVKFQMALVACKQ